MSQSSKVLDLRTVAGADSRRVGVLLHGFGADASDLLPLCPYLDRGQELKWLVPEAPISFADFGFPGGRAWFPGTVQELSHALTGSYFRNLAQLDPPSLAQAATLVRNTIRAHVPDGEVVALAGFSQGAMVAVESLLSGLVQPRSLFLFSGALIARDRWSALTPPVSPRLFQSHGTEDPILPIACGHALHELLKGKGLSGPMRTFAGGHAIPEDVIRAAAGILSEVVANG
jgi:phospholipase/carboxylesterase